MFVRDGGSGWTLLARLTAADAATGDQFGLSVSLSDDTAVIGSPFDDDGGDAAGSAYVFARDGSGSWTQQAKLTAANAASFGRFGEAVSLSGNAAVVDAIGSAYRFRRDTGGTWTQRAKLVGDAAERDLGRSVSLSGNTALLGTLYAGAAYVDAAFPLYNLGGFALWRIDIPPMPQLVGLRIYMQGGVIDFGANAANVILTNAGEAVIVGR